MRKNDNKLITITDETQIERPASREMFPVEKTDWRRIKRLIKKIDISSNRWENFAWFMGAATIAFLVELLTQEDDKWLIFFVFSLIITIIVSVVAYKFSKTKHDSKREVVLEMDEIEKKTAKETEENVVVGPDNLRILEAIYGTTERKKDITQEIKALVKDNKLSIRASNDIAGDPYPGVVKKLRIRYEFQGEELEKEYTEGELVNLP